MTKIIHKGKLSENSYLGVKHSSVLRKKMIYLCNQACSTSTDKLSWRWNKVTCKNCLKQNKETKGD